MKLRFSLLVAILIVFGTTAYAASSSSILVDITPPNPAPYEDTSISLNSYANNLDSVLITWSVNGKSVLSGIGKKSFSLKAPAAGSETAVGALISLPDGNIETKILIRPSVMVLLWQANDSYIPPFYRGKALATADSEVKIVAMPEVKTSSGLTSPKNMTYAWKKDYTNEQDASGYGRNFFLYINDYLENSNNISVVASTVDQKYSSEANIDVGTTQPKILFYKNNSLLGTLWNMALSDTYKINGAEMVRAIPYFISPKEILNPRLVWSWFINDSPVSILGYRKNLIPLKAQEGVSGTSKLRLEINNQDKIFETASKEINIEF